MPILNELFSTWISTLSLLTIGFIFGMGVFQFVCMRRQMIK